VTDTIELSATALIEEYRAKRLSPVEATQATFDRIAALDDQLNAFCHLDQDAAMASARESEARWSKGEPVGRLDGIPISVKDTIMLKGWPFMRGSRTSDPRQLPDEDAPAVERLRQHGAVLVGKTNTPEFGWKGTTDSELFGITRNPWDRERTPGGSSGGAAASVAAGVTPLALGTDGAGSIRIPCSFSGLFGIKATAGRVPVAPVAPFGSLAHVGPIARNVTDAALMLNALKGWDSRDWYALPDDATDYSEVIGDSVDGLKIAYSPTFGYARVDDEVGAIVATAARAFGELGAIVEQVDKPFDDPTEILWAHWRVGLALLLTLFTPEQIELLEAGLVETAREGPGLPVMDYAAAIHGRRQLGIHMGRFHQSYDLLLSPTLAVPAFGVGRLAPEGFDGEPCFGWTPFTYPFNLTRQPAASVLCGFTQAGLPVGLQIVGPPLREDLVFRAARSYEAAHSWGDRRPPV